MGRPKRVKFEDFYLYDKLHTKKEKMISGVEMTILYPIKETALFFRSIEVWSYCTSLFKAKKKNFKLNFDIPIIEDQKTIKFLKDNCWKDWVKKGLKEKDNEMIEVIQLLNNIFPNHEKLFFYELDSLLSSYCHGTFLRYKEDGSIDDNLSEGRLKSQKYYNYKYNKFCEAEEVVMARKKWTDEKDATKVKKYLTEYHDIERDYVFKHYNLIDIFVEIGKNAVCYPIAFKRGTAEWSKEKYGKEIAYAHAGEIYFVVTQDSIYFETKRHF